MRVLISGGGTGGHVYPALAVAAELKSVPSHVPPEHAQQKNAQPAAARRDLEQVARSQPNAVAQAAPISALPKANDEEAVDLLWIGSSDGMEEALVDRARIPYEGIDSGKLNGVGLIQGFRNANRVWRGVGQANQLVREFQPDICFATGGYVCAPVVFACWLLGVPVLLYLPDMAPGWTIRGLSYFARQVAVSLPGAAKYFGGQVPAGKAVVTGYPVRPELLEAVQDRRQARQRLSEEISPALAKDSRPILLVMGGSQGARSINQALWATLPQLLPEAHVLHIVGERDWLVLSHELEDAIGSVPDALRERYHPVAYLHEEMALAIAAADLCIARAGASTLGEFPVAQLPSILVPLPFGGVKQMQNARELAEYGGASIVADEALMEELLPTVLTLLQCTQKRKIMEESLRDLAHPQAAQNIAKQLVMLATVRRSHE